MNRPRLRLAAAAAAAGLILSVTSCATTIDGVATAASHVAAAQSSTASAEAPGTEPAEPESTATAEAPAPQTPIAPIDPTALDPADATTGGAAPGTDGAGGTVDAAGAAWLSGFCTGFSDVRQYAAPDTTGMSVDAALQTISDAYTGMAQAAGEAATNLQAMPQPTFPGADVLAPAINAWLLAVNAVYSAGAGTITSTTFTSEDELTATINTIEAGMTAPNAAISSAIGTMDPTVRATLTTLPECQGLITTG